MVTGGVVLVGGSAITGVAAELTGTEGPAAFEAVTSTTRVVPDVAGAERIGLPGRPLDTG